MSDEPESLMLRLLREIRADIERVDAKMATKDDIADVRSEIKSLRADVGSDIHELDHKIERQTGALRRQLVEYHTSVIGHGILISELEGRVRRVEQHLNLPPVETH